MRRTKILTSILSLLIVSLCALILYKNIDISVESIDNIINTVKGNKIEIPEYTKNSIDYNFKTIQNTDNFEPHNIEDIKQIYYTVLNNGWNKFKFYCPKEYTNCINDVVSFANSDETLSLLNNYVSPYNSYKKYNSLIIGKEEVLITIERLYSDDEINYVKEKITKIIKDLEINIEKPTILDLKTIHNYIIKNTTYDEDYTEEDINTISNKAYGLFINKKALCSGYSDTFALFLNELNIPNFKVSSKDHVWNAVYINNEWLHIDVTWDDDEINKNNNYNFFLKTTDELLKLDSSKHTFNKELYKELN